MLGFCVVGMADPQFAYAKLPIVGRVTVFQTLLAFAVVLGLVTLLRLAGSPERSITRTMCRIVLAYLLVELLLVIPVALGIGDTKLTVIVGTMDVRVAWLLFPVVLAICADERTRRRAGAAAVIAAACVAAYGVFASATGGGGYYLEFGVMRYRVLQGSAFLLFAWPFVLAVSGAVSRRYSVAFLVLASVGLVLANQRSGLIAFAVAGLVCLGMSGQYRRILPALVPITLVAAIVALLWERQANSVFGFTLSHLLDISSGNGADRLMRWRLAWDFFVSHPFNDYVWSWRYYSTYLSDAYQPHNFVLEIAGREGVVGLAFYGSMLWAVLRGAWNWGRHDAEARALIGWLVFYVVFSLMNANHYLPTSLPLLVAATAALASRVDWLRRVGGHGTSPDVPAEVHA
jgi:O-antigen ligase